MYFTSTASSCTTCVLSPKASQCRGFRPHDRNAKRIPRTRQESLYRNPGTACAAACRASARSISFDAGERLGGPAPEDHLHPTAEPEDGQPWLDIWREERDCGDRQGSIESHGGEGHRRTWGLTGHQAPQPAYSEESVGKSSSRRYIRIMSYAPVTTGMFFTVFELLCKSSSLPDSCIV